jgi:hypothetical protein
MFKILKDTTTPSQFRIVTGYSYRFGEYETLTFAPSNGASRPISTVTNTTEESAFAAHDQKIATYYCYGNYHY